MNKKYDIADDDIVFIEGKHSQWYKQPRNWLIIGAVVAVVGIVIVGTMLFSHQYQSAPLVAVEPEDSVYRIDYADPFADVDTSVSALYIYNDTIDFIPVRFYYPVNASAELRVGKQTLDDSTMLIIEAAGIRADNNHINGAFVLNGELLSRGMSKSGYCAIIDDVLHIGCEEATAYMEMAIEHNGFFFRQYPLIHNGRMVETRRREKAQRRSLCLYRGKYVVIETLSRESMINFMLMLQDIGVSEGIYLPGANSWGYYSQLHAITEFGYKEDSVPQTINYIAWKYKP